MKEAYSSPKFKHKLYERFATLDYAPLKPGSVRLELFINGRSQTIQEPSSVRCDGTLGYNNGSWVEWGRVHYGTGEVERLIGFAEGEYDREAAEEG